MAVVVAKEDAEKFIAAANRENLEATVVAEVTAEPRLVMRWNGNIICDIKRKFLNSNGAGEAYGRARCRHAAWRPAKCRRARLRKNDRADERSEHLQQKSDCPNGFDSTIGAGTVLMPFGGRTQLTPVQAMAAKLPVPQARQRPAPAWPGVTTPSSPNRASTTAPTWPWPRAFPSWWPPVFPPKTPISRSRNTSSARARTPAWGRPMASLLGALDAQVGLGVAAIGGKDSMSGSFENIDVPPTLVSFAAAAGNTDNVVSPEFKLPGSKLVLLSPAMRDGLLPNAGSLKLLWAQVETLIKEKKGAFCLHAVHGRSGRGTVQKWAWATAWGVRFAPGFDAAKLYGYAYGSFVLELAEDIDVGTPIGETTARYVWELNGETADRQSAGSL